MTYTVFLAAIVRHALAALGVWLVSKNFIDAGTGTQMVNLTATVMGSLLALGAMAWSLWQKHEAEIEKAISRQLPAGSTAGDVANVTENDVARERLLAADAKAHAP